VFDAYKYDLRDGGLSKAAAYISNSQGWGREFNCRRKPNAMASRTKTACLLTILRITLLLVVSTVILSSSLCHGARDAYAYG
jgi:hypothetical protein